jgi:hypothetical protein
MTAPTTAPLKIAPDAAAYVAELGMQPQFEQMLEHARQTIPGLRALDVTLQPPYDLGGGPCVVIDVTSDDPRTADHPTEREFGYWQIETFPPEVNQHFTLLLTYRPADAG